MKINFLLLLERRVLGESLKKILYRFNKVPEAIIDEYSTVSLDLLGYIETDCVQLREDETCLLEILMNRSPSNIGIKFEEDFMDAENAEVDRYNAEKLNKIGNLSRALWRLTVRPVENAGAWSEISCMRACQVFTDMPIFIIVEWRGTITLVHHIPRMVKERGNGFQCRLLRSF
uniref:Uncharacterized protein n=1 Tax=Hyaloperonospora arabidopsidis (strain Emoy2) TaxID=559515 RepID=M4BAA3_HYAAE